MGKLIASFLVLVFVLAQTPWVGVASAHVVLCLDDPALHNYLTNRHGEVVMHTAVTSSGGFIKIYMNPRTGKWTLVITQTLGISCLVFSGEGWRGPLIPEKGGQDAKR